ncbi:MAG: serine--tRNA ligase, partial [Bacteroidota bacterium]
MLQLGFIRQNTELVKKKLAVKNFKQPELVDELIKWDDKRKQYQLEQEEIQANINASSKEIGQYMAKGEKEKAEEIKKKVADWKIQLAPDKLNEAEKNIEAILYLLPNLPSDKVPPGKTPEDNVVIREG